MQQRAISSSVIEQYWGRVGVSVHPLPPSLRALMSRVALRFCHHHFDIFQSGAESCEIFRCRPKGDWTDREPTQNAPHVGSVSRDIAFDKTRAFATARARIFSGSSAEPDNRHPRRGKGTTRDFCHRRARAGLLEKPHEVADLARSAGESPAVAGPRPSLRGAR